MCAAHHELSNLVAFIDYNKLQSDASNESIMNVEPLVDKWKSFGWNVIVNAHSYNEIDAAYSSISYAASPVLFIAHSIKGKGSRLWRTNLLAW